MNERFLAIQALVQRALETSIKNPGSEFVDVASAVKLHPEVSTLAELDYFWDEYSIQIGLEPRMKYMAQLLESLAPLHLSSAPELIGVLPAGKDHSVLVTRYKVEPGEQIYPIKATCIMPSAAAQERLLEDMRTLASRSQIHAYARGFFHWFISSKTHRLVLNAWSSFRDCPQTEANQMIERVEGVMDGIKEEHSKNRIRQTFGVSRVLLPVVHPVSWEQALASTQIAVDAGVKGIFLINQGLDAEAVLRLVLEVRKRHPSLWVGLNLLGYSPAQALETALEACEGRIDGIWADNASIEEDDAEQPRAQAFLEARERLGWTGLYFGGVAFKYQREVSTEKLPAATRLARTYMDVICTSGPGTARHADPQKVATMRAAVGPSSSIALASGVTTENVSHYLPYVNAYLVGTGLEQSFGVLDPAKVAALQAAISGYGT
jgi:uncharacterized protein